MTIMFLYFLGVAIFFSGLLYYLIDRSLVPYNEESLVDVQNLLIVSIVLIAAITSYIGSLHVLIDKLFFRKFYQKARPALAVRRGFLLGLWCVSLGWLRIFGFWYWHIILLISILTILFEAFLMGISMQVSHKKKSAIRKNDEKD